MSTYVVTFRISQQTVGGKSYQDRYDALVQRLMELEQGNWQDTTSFYLISSDENTNAFAKRITRGLSSEHDMLFTFDPEDQSGCYFGDLAAEDVLLSFFPLAKKLG